MKRQMLFHKKQGLTKKKIEILTVINIFLKWHILNIKSPARDVTKEERITKPKHLL